jgi:hypothetical protein
MEPAKALKAIESIRNRWLKIFKSGISLTWHQAPYLKDTPAKGPMWVSRINVPTDGDNSIVQAIVEVIRTLGDGSETFDVPTCINLQGEWIGQRSGVDKSTIEPNIPEEEKYDMLMKEVGNDSVLFYAHGGAG